MRILLDECVDWRLSRAIVGHEVKSARQMGWLAIKNGELLALAAEYFDIFVTVDRNLSSQQNIRGLPIAIIVIQARTNRTSDLLPAVPRLLKAIEFASPRCCHDRQRLDRALHLHPAQSRLNVPDLVFDELDEFHEFVDGVGDRVQFLAGIDFRPCAPGAFLDLGS